MANSAPFTSSVFYDNSTDAHFRSWGSALSAAFAGVGFVQTADTGQVNWTTVTRPLAASTLQGYEVWKGGDSLQSTAPIFFRVDYGSNLNTANQPGITVQLGTSSDGAGNITGNKPPLITIGGLGTTADATNQYECDFSGCASGGVGSTYVGNTFAIIMFRCNASTGVVTGAMPWMLLLERSMDSSGAYTGDYFTFIATWGSGGGNNPAAQISVSCQPNGGYGPFNAGSNTNPFTTSGGGYTFSLCQPYLNAGTDTALQNSTYVSCLFTCPLWGYIGNPLTCFMHCMRGDVTEPSIGVGSNTFTILDAYGKPHTYATFKGGNATGNYNTAIADNQNYAVLLRWE